MNVSAITDSKKNMFIKYANQFMSLNHSYNSKVVEPPKDDDNKQMGIETLTSYSIFPKQVINGKTIYIA